MNRNDFTGAFQRIVDESSSYYVVGYSPARAAKPGEFRSIAVKVSRPGVSISARNGYSGRVEPAVRRNASDVPVAEPSSGFPMPSPRGRGRAPEPPMPSSERHGLAAWRPRSRRCSRARCHSPGCRFAFKP